MDSTRRLNLSTPQSSFTSSQRSASPGRYASYPNYRPTSSSAYSRGQTDGDSLLAIPRYTPPVWLGDLSYARSPSPSPLGLLRAPSPSFAARTSRSPSPRPPPPPSTASSPYTPPFRRSGTPLSSTPRVPAPRPLPVSLSQRSLSRASPLQLSPSSPSTNHVFLHPRQLSSSGRTSPVQVFGDSFAGVFELLPRGKARVNRYKGASARGLSNQASQLGVATKVLAELDEGLPNAKVVLMFGHVDFTVNYLWQLKAKGRDALRPSEWVQLVAEDYTSFLSSSILPRLRSGRLDLVYVAAVTMPVVQDYALEQCVKKYTDLLSSFCARHEGLVWIDINPYITQGVNGEVNPIFTDREDPTNIHLIWERTIDLWSQQIPSLRSAIARTDQDMAKLERGLATYRLEKRDRLRLQGIAGQGRGLSVG